MARLLIEKGGGCGSGWWEWNNVTRVDGPEAVAHLLLGKGAEDSVQCKNGDTPLYWASYWGGAVLVNLLLRNGAGISAVNNLGLIALQGAALRGYVTIVQILHEKEAGISGFEC